MVFIYLYKRLKHHLINLLPLSLYYQLIDMDQNRNQENMYRTAKKKPQEIEGTSAKRLKVTQIQKIRLSNIKSLSPRNIAPINFHSLLGREKKQKRESLKSSVDLELLKMLDQQHEKIKSASIALAKEIQDVEQLQKQIPKSKIFIEQIRDTYFENQHLLNKEKEYLVKISDTYPLKKKLTELEYEEKKSIYELSSKEEELLHSIKLGKQQIQKLNSVLDKNLVYFSQVTEKVKQAQLEKKDLALSLAKKKKALDEAKHNYNLQLSQIFVLKIQTNSNLCSGMIYNKIGIDRKLLLQKDYFQWDKSKQKKLTFEDLKRFVLIQLCHGWKTLLRKLSYQSSQYQVLFGEIKNEAVLEDLRRFLSYDKLRSSYKKSPKAIIFYSQIAVQTGRKQKILNLFKNFDNGIIRINNTQFIEFEGVFELQISYTYLNDCQLKQRFTFEEHNYINKQKILKDIKSSERRTFLLIQIPFVALKQDLLRYDEVYEVIRKKTGNTMNASLKSLK